MEAQKKEEILGLISDGLWTDGEDVKQACLWQLAMMLGFEAKDFTKEPKGSKIGDYAIKEHEKVEE